MKNLFDTYYVTYTYINNEKKCNTYTRGHNTMYITKIYYIKNNLQ